MNSERVKRQAWPVDPAVYPLSGPTKGAAMRTVPALKSRWARVIEFLFGGEPDDGFNGAGHNG